MTDIAAPTTEATVESTEPQGQDPNPGSSWMDRIKKRYGDNPGEAREAELAGKSPAEVQKTADAAPEQGKDGAKDSKAAEETAKTGEAEETPPKAAEKPAPNRVELRNVQLMSENQRLTTDLVSFKSRAETAEAFKNEVIEAFSKHPFKALEKYAGKTLPELVELGKKGVFDKPEVDLPPDVKKKLEWVEQEQARRAAEEEKIQRQQEFSSDLPKVRQYLESFADKLPFSSMIDGAAEDILTVYYQRDDAAKKSGGKRPDIRAVAAELEAVVAQNMIDTLSNPSLLKFLASNQDLKKILLEAIGLNGNEQQKIANPVSGTQGDTNGKPKLQHANPPASVAAIATEIPERTSRELTDEELREESIKLFRQAREGGMFNPT